MNQDGNDVEPSGVRWHEEHELVSVHPISRRVDAIYAREDGSFFRVAVIGLQVYKTTSICEDANTGRELKREEEPGVFSCFLRSLSKAIMNVKWVRTKKMREFPGVRRRGRRTSKQSWRKKAREYALKKKGKTRGQEIFPQIDRDKKDS